MTEPTAPADPLSADASRKLVVRAFIAVILGVLLGEYFSLGYTLVYPALPRIAAQFHTTNLAWSVAIVSLADVPIFPLAGKLSDRFGAKNTAIALAATFAVGSFVCAIATSYGVFLLGRVLEGIGSALSVILYAYVRSVLPKRWVAVGLGVTVTGLGVSGIGGPFLANWLINSWGISGIFWFLFIYTAVLTTVFAVVSPDVTIRSRRKLDLPSGIVLGGGLGLILLGICFGGTWGWTSASVLASFFGGGALIALAVARMLLISEPLLDLRALASPRLRTTMLYVFLISFPATGYAFLLPQMLETPRLPGIGYGFGATTLHYAIYLLPFGIVSILVGPLAGALCRSWNPRAVARVGAAVSVVGMVLFALLTTQSWMIFLGFGVYGIGFAFFFAAFPNLTAQAASPDEMGTASGVMLTALNIAGSIGPVVLGSILAANVFKVFPAAHAVVYDDAGFRVCFLLLAGFALLGLVVALLMRHGAMSAAATEDEAVPVTAGAGEAVAG
jgi:MFS family permease